MNTFEELNVWKIAREIRIEISKLLKNFPESENYILKNQMLRASRSIAANIAEGHGRFHYLENIQFCRISRGSLMELLEHLICSKDENYIDENQFSELRERILLCNKILNGYIAYLTNSKKESEDKKRKN